MDQTFDSRLQPETYSLATSSATVMSKTYSYNADGRLRHVDDGMNAKFDRLNTYDHQGRIHQAKSSAEANGGTTSDPFYDRPYLQTYSWDSFGNLKNRDNKLWHADSNLAQDYTFANNRITNTSPNAFAYDNDGRVVQTPYLETIADTTYDAAGRIDVHHTKPAPTEHEDKVTRHYDGEGREAKRVTDRCRVILPEDPEDPCTWQGDQKSYYVRSTVLGGEVVFGDGRFVYAGGVKLAELTKRVEFTGGPSGTMYDSVNFHHADAAGVSQRVTRNYPEALLGQPSSDPNYIDPRQGEFDPMGNNVGTVTNYSPQYIPSDPNMIPIEGEHPMYINGQRVSAELDGLSVSWQTIGMLADHGVIGVSGPGGSIIPVSGGPGGIRWTRLEITIPIGRDGDMLYQTGNATATFYMGGISWGPSAKRNNDSFAVQTRRGPTLGKGVPENLKDLVLGLAADGKCGEVFQQLIQTSSKKYKEWQKKSQKSGKSIIETMYDSLKSVNINPKRSAEGTNAGGHVELGDYNDDPRGLFATQQRFALITLQETIHQVFSDADLRKASKRLYDSGKLDPAIKSKVDRKNLYEHALLSAACGRTDQELTNGAPTP